MDLNFLYSDFVMDDREVLFHSAPGAVSSFHDDEGNMYCAVPAFRHSDADLARDPLSTNRRLVNTEELAIFGTMAVAGATADHIKVLIPDTFSGLTVNADSPVVLQHVVGLTLGPAVDLSSSLPAPNLDRALCRNSVLPTLTKRRWSYWAEVNPILRRCRMLTTLSARYAMDWSEWICLDTYDSHNDLPVLLALPCSDLPGVVRIGIIWKRSLGGGT